MARKTAKTENVLTVAISPEDAAQIMAIGHEAQSYVHCIHAAHNTDEREMWRKKWRDCQATYLHHLERIMRTYLSEEDYELIIPGTPQHIDITLNRLVVRIGEIEDVAGGHPSD
jgi:hypothetical protein